MLNVVAAVMNCPPLPSINGHDAVDGEEPRESEESDRLFEVSEMFNVDTVESELVVWIKASHLIVGDELFKENEMIQIPTVLMQSTINESF